VGSRWLVISAVLALGFVAGAATIVFADAGDDGARVAAPTPVVAASPASATGDAPTTLNGEPIHGVKAHDIAAESQPDRPLDAATRDQLRAQLMGAREITMRYPTVADAVAGGYRLAGGFAPGSGAHYVMMSGAGLSGNGPVDVTSPNSLIYDGTNPGSRMVGLMYYAIGGEHPEGFAGPNDHWHRHANVCIKYGANGIEVPFPADADVTAKQCREAQGTLLGQTGWMVHAWVAPSWESPQGVFSHDNVNLRCADGTFNTDKAGFCQGT
jgi:hypothetical protein